MTLFRIAIPLVLAAASLAATSTSGGRLCRMVPGTTIALVRVEKDTTLAFAPSPVDAMSMSGVRPGPLDTLLATASTQMPAARVRMTGLDSATRHALAARGITDAEPVAFMRAAPYRADCRTIRWTDPFPFLEAGEVAFMRANLAPRDQWVGGLPVFVVHDYEYLRQRAPDGRATAPAMFSLTAALEMPPARTQAERIIRDRAQRTRALAWAAANSDAAELEPVRSIVRRAVLEADWQEAEQIPSRLRGTYRVDFEVDGERSSFFFRSADRPGYSWPGPGAPQTTAAMLASPHVLGYRLVGDAGPSIDSLPTAPVRGLNRPPLVWLATTDRPTAPGNETRRDLTAILEFMLGAAPTKLWNDLEQFVPRQSAADSAMWVRLKLGRDRKQPQIPVTVRLDAAGGVRADTTLAVGGRTLRVTLQRLDTVSTRRPW